MDAAERYSRWRAMKLEDEELTAQLEAIAGDETEIHERFYTDLEFGTAGLRGVMGAGTNRMNIYTVRRATQGLAQYVLQKFKDPSAAVAYDSRNNSRRFAEAAASVLAANGVRVFLYPAIAPTPMLSWAVRHYGCATGIVVTASHNPAEYNGYKVYGPDGCQLSGEASDEVLASINGLDLFDGVRTLPFEQAVESGMVRPVDDACVQQYYEQVLNCRLMPQLPRQAKLSVAYTPLCGAGSIPVRHVLGACGVRDLWTVPAQQEPDGNFPTCRYPNPEMPEAMAAVIALAAGHNADLALGTDPDADRVGLAVRHNGAYTLLTGNQVGIVLTDYIGRVRTERGIMPERPVLVKSVVTSVLAALTAASYGIETVDVLTGFKHIGGAITRLEEKGEENRVVFAFEESCGYLPGIYVRDKDAVSTAALLAEAAAYHKLAGRTLIDALEEIYERVGCFADAVDNIAFPGSNGMARMAALMDDLFAAPPKELAGVCVAARGDFRLGVRVRDGRSAPIDLPRTDMLLFDLEEGSRVIVRPSGTEPKLKIYYTVKGRDPADAKAREESLRKAARAQLGV